MTFPQIKAELYAEFSQIFQSTWRSSSVNDYHLSSSIMSNKENKYHLFFWSLLNRDFDVVQGIQWTLEDEFWDIDETKKKKKSKKRKSFDLFSKESDAFDKRIGDNLCQIILSYLSISDKFRLECVCRQFQRKIFAEQRNLVIRYANHVILAIRADHGGLLRQGDWRGNCQDGQTTKTLLQSFH